MNLRQRHPSEGLYIRVIQNDLDLKPLRSFDNFLSRIICCTLSTHEQQAKYTTDVLKRVVVLKCGFSTVHFKLDTTQRQKIISSGRVPHFSYKIVGDHAKGT